MSIVIRINENTFSFLFGLISQHWKFILPLGIGVTLGIVSVHFDKSLAFAKNYFGLSSYSYPSQSYQPEQILYSIYESAPVRETPTIQEQSIKQHLKMGEPVLYTGKMSSHLLTSKVNGKLIKEYFLQVKVLKNGVYGFVFAGSLSPQTLKEYTTNTNSKNAAKKVTDFMITKGNGINIRTNPSIASDNIKGQLDRDEIVLFTNKSENKQIIYACGNSSAEAWYHVELPTDPTINGWVYGGCLSHLNEDQQLDSFREEEEF